jgi:hypothetical protein
MVSYAFIQKEAGVETVRLCVTDATPTLRLLSGDTKATSVVLVGDVLKNGNDALRVDEIVTA